MKEILLTKGKVAIIDDEDFDRVSAYTWCFDRYACRGVWKSTKVYMHKFIFGKVPEEFLVDHINGNKLDNRKENLRLIGRRGNALNSNKKWGKSGIRGVVKHRNKWVAQIGRRDELGKPANGYIGIFETKELAQMAYEIERGKGIL